MLELTEAWRCQNLSIGFVPTMGALHEGHIALFRRARAENQKFVASIFVNPTQFLKGEDLEKYPRPFERDCSLLEQAGCDSLFFPAPEAMYQSNASTMVEVESLSTQWEGASRPGHFRGVATIVAKLFNLVRAHRAYFGEKDFQQLKIIEALSRDLNFDVEVVACATVREADGLALSSRNEYLNRVERAAAPVIFRALQAAQTAVQDGEYSAVRLTQVIQETLRNEPLIVEEYSAIVDSNSLEPLEVLDPKKPARALIAARAGSTRLIDNVALIT